MSAHPHRPTVGRPVTGGQSTLTEDIVPLGYMVFDLAAFIDAIDEKATVTQADVATLRDAATRISDAITAVNDGISVLSRTAQETEDAAAGRMESIAANTDRFRRMAEWGTAISARTYSLEAALGDIVGANGQIARIARQVNILAVNASIEAARAGDAGRGFAIVAEAINELSRKTADAAGGVSNSIASLEEWTRSMRKDAELYAPDFKSGVEGALETRRVVEGIAADMTKARNQIEKLEQSMLSLDHDNTRAEPIYDALSRSSRETAQEVGEARLRSSQMMDLCETLLQRSVQIDDGGPDRRIIDYTQTLAHRVSEAMRDGMRRGLIDQRALFDFRYREIRGTDPVQHDTAFAGFTDQVVQDILEEALTFDPSITFCAICDRNGYIPTHNLKFSHRPSDDPAWNAAHCRNRRIFSDRTGTKAGANRAPFLMQVYRRDMGSEGVVMMKDVSAPIMIDGRHWGGLRIGCRSQAAERG
ncbi:methyl-accepting chemotaxis protein [Jannaschia sp. 2305UL9-9]|uniref:methyl-accepting chemotaxis protein n=1 Tax=Jannaschia sp. 2305UL9-9 TaxID=3121638 RepID=UPI0035283A99